MNDIKNAYTRESAPYSGAGRRESEAFLAENRGMLREEMPRNEEANLRKTNSKEISRFSDLKRRGNSKQEEAKQDASRFLAGLSGDKEDENPFLEGQETYEKPEKQQIEESQEKLDLRKVIGSQKVDLRSRIPIKNVENKPRESILQRLIKKPAA